MLNQIFNPRSIALVGASTTPGKLGFDILSNLVNLDYLGEIYPINPSAISILGKTAYASILQVPAQIDLVIIAVPAKLVINIIKDCITKDIKNIVIISAGFKETGEEGKQREEEIKNLLIQYKLNIIGPNCLGIINTHLNLNASFAEGLARKGNIALISQSGAMAVAVTDWAYSENIGFSKIISLGNKVGINENDCLEYLAKDNDTEVILLYLESFVDGEKFRQIATKTAKNKVIILFKSGTSLAGSSAVASHTGALAGADTAVETALRQSGVIRTRTIEDLFDFARVFSMQCLPQGGKVAIITNAGGPGVIATDAVEQSVFLEIAQFTEDTKNKLRTVLPVTASVNNPVDIIGDALADRYQSALEHVLADENTDMLLTILTPQIMTQQESTVRILNYYNKQYPQKPIFTSFIGGKSIKYFAEKLAENNIPNFIDPARAIRSMKVMGFLRYWRQKQATIPQCALYNIPPMLKQKITAELELNNKLSADIINELLTAYEIPLPVSKIVNSANEAVNFSQEVKYPVVLKIESPDILHKTDMGGVFLNLATEEEVKIAYQKIMENARQNMPQAKITGVLVQKMYKTGKEIIIGMKRDPVFGPLIMFGLGGVYVEVLKDVAFRVAPLSLVEAYDMIGEIKAIKLLTGTRGEEACDITIIAEIITKIASLAIDFPSIKEIDLNPLLVFSKGEGAVVLDSVFI